MSSPQPRRRHADATEHDDAPPANSATPPSPHPPLRSSRTNDAVDADLAELINLGLSLGDVERLWGGVEGVSAEAIHTAGQRLLTAGNTGMVPLGRQTSLGLDLVSRRGAEATELDVSPVLVALKAEVDDPPDRFRDPIMLTLMDEPVVISSGHHFDRATLYDARDRFRFKQCPMTRCDIEPRAYPLVYLKRELVEWKLARLDKVLEAAAACQAAPAAQLLAFAKQLIDSLGGDTYQHRAAQYWKLRCAVINDDPTRWSTRSRARGGARPRAAEQRRDLRGADDQVLASCPQRFRRRPQRHLRSSAGRR